APPADRRPPRSSVQKTGLARRPTAGRLEEAFMRTVRVSCAVVAAVAFSLGASTASAQDSPQVLRQDIDQLRRDFEALKQQYGDRLAALEAKLAAAEGQPPVPGAPPAATAPGAAQPPGQPAQPSAPVPAGAEGAGGPSGALPVYGAAVA